MSQEIEELRTEIAALRRDLDLVLQRLGRVGNIEPENPNHHLGYDAHYLRTPMIEVYDHHHGPRVEILAEDETAGIFLRDGQGKSVASFQIGPGGAALEFAGAKTGQCPALSLDGREGHGTVYVSAPDGKVRAMMRSAPQGGLIAVMPEQNKASAFMLAGPEGGVIEVVNNGHKTGLSLHAKDDGGYIRVHENSGEVMALMGGNVDSGVITVFGPQGEEAVTLAADETGGLINFSDAAGEPKSRLP